MEAMQETFIPALNEFIELWKKANSMHTEHVSGLKELQKQLLQNNTKAKEQAALKVANGHVSPEQAKKLVERCNRTSLLKFVGSVRDIDLCGAVERGIDERQA